MTEDEEDLADVARNRDDWVAAGRPTVPLAVVQRVRAGDSLVRASRLDRGTSQAELATKVGISPDDLREIEEGLRLPDEQLRRKLAEFLDLHPIFFELL